MININNKLIKLKNKLKIQLNKELKSLKYKLKNK